MMGAEKQSGVVVKFDRDRGYGFLRPDDADADLFFHASQAPLNCQCPQPGHRVSFVSAISPAGRPQAERLQLEEE
jgi:cold shock CspA family protein